MKKFVSLVMAGAMIASMAVAANAVYEAEADAGKVAFDVPKARVAVEYDGVIDVDAGEYYEIELKDSCSLMPLTPTQVLQTLRRLTLSSSCPGTMTASTLQLRLT